MADLAQKIQPRFRLKALLHSAIKANWLDGIYSFLKQKVYACNIWVILKPLSMEKMVWKLIRITIELIIYVGQR